MIRDLSDTLDAFFNQPGLPPDLQNAQTSFERPTEPFEPGQPTINLFLFDIRENVELRNNEPITRRAGGVTFVQPPPIRLTCTYLVTAWPSPGPDYPQREQRLLSQLLRLIAAAPVIPSVFLAGSLAGQEPPLPVMLLQPDGVRNPAEFWAAIGNKMRAALLLAVTFTMPVGDEADFPEVIAHRLSIRPSLNPAAVPETIFRIGGVVRDAATNPVPAATVRLLELPRSTATNLRGEYTIPAIPAGNYTLRASAGPLTKDKAITVPAPLGSDFDTVLT